MERTFHTVIHDGNYRRQEWVNGVVTRVEESCRRPVVVPPKSDAPRVSHVSSREGSVAFEASTRPELHRNSKKRLSKLRRGKIESVVVQHQVSESRDRAAESNPTIRVSQSRMMLSDMRKDLMPTPPPTPLLRRLPTPDIPELEVSPFCSCCERSLISKFCTGCGCTLKKP